MNVLIVDDDRLVGMAIKHFVEKTEDAALCTLVTDGAAALRALSAGGVDVVFLDLELPEVGGRDVLKAIPKGLPVVVVTSHSDFAANSYEFDVVDFLVKPVDLARFFRAWQKVRERRGPAADGPRTIVVRDGQKLVQVALDRLLFLDAETNYTRFVCIDRTVMSLVSLKQLESSLPPQFVRVHRSYIVNLRRIEQLEGNAIKIGTHKVPVGETYREELLKRFSPVN